MESIGGFFFLMGKIPAYVYTDRSGLVEWEEVLGGCLSRQRWIGSSAQVRGLPSEWSMEISGRNFLPTGQKPDGGFLQMLMEG